MVKWCFTRSTPGAKGFRFLDRAFPRESNVSGEQNKIHPACSGVYEFRPQQPLREGKGYEPSDSGVEQVGGFIPFLWSRDEAIKPLRLASTLQVNGSQF
jgi:hypothetical protein